MNNDLISRSALLNQRPEYLNPDHVDIEKALFAKGWNACNSEYYSLITDSAALEAEPVRHARWLPTNDDNKKLCSRCDVIHLIAQYPHGQANYCPNCGANMRGDESASE